MNEELKYVKLHVAPFYPGLGQMTNTLDVSVLKGAKLYYQPDAVVLEYKNIRTLIPHANVVCAISAGRPVIQLPAPSGVTVAGVKINT